MKTAISALAVTGLLLGAGAAQAKTVSYKGKATGGYHVTFKKSGNKVRNLKAGVPTTCLASTTGYPPNSGSDLFNPPGSFPIGKTTKTKKLQKTGLWYSKVTKNYHVTLKKAGKKIKGKLHMNFSYAMPVFDYYNPHLVIYICRGDAKFTARPV
jgi:hypothetical protein